jgi:hypothetical protein
LHISKTLQAAFILQERDMTSQSMALCRNALEAAYVWRHLENNPNSTKIWFDIESDDGRTFRFPKLLQSTEGDRKALSLYRLLCKYSHPSGMVFWSGVSISPSDYSIAHRCLSCVFILKVTNRFLCVVQEQFPNQLFRNDKAILDWQNRAKPVAEQLQSDFERKVEEALRNENVE